MADTLQIDEFIEQLRDVDFGHLSDLIAQEAHRRAQGLARGEGAARNRPVPLSTAAVIEVSVPRKRGNMLATQSCEICGERYDVTEHEWKCEVCGAPEAHDPSLGTPESGEAALELLWDENFDAVPIMWLIARTLAGHAWLHRHINGDHPGWRSPRTVLGDPREMIQVVTGALHHGLQVKRT